MSYLGKSQTTKKLLAENIPYLVDVDGGTPFDHCFENKDFETISHIFHHMESKLWQLEYNAFAYAIQSIDQESLRMIKNTLFTFSPILDNVPLPVTGTILNGNN